MKLFKIDLESQDHVLLLRIGVMADTVMRKEKGREPAKFSLASRAVENMLTLQPISLLQFNGLADTVGGYFMATNVAVQKYGAPISDISVATEMMELVEKIRKQIKVLELVKDPPDIIIP